MLWPGKSDIARAGGQGAVTEAGWGTGWGNRTRDGPGEQHRGPPYGGRCVGDGAPRTAHRCRACARTLSLHP